MDTTKGPSQTFDAQLARAGVWTLFVVFLGTYLGLIVFHKLWLHWPTPVRGVVSASGATLAGLLWWVAVIAPKLRGWRRLPGELPSRAMWPWVLGVGVFPLTFQLASWAFRYSGPGAMAPPASSVTGFVLHAFLFVVLLPVCEELLFRGILFRALRARIGGAWAALLSSALFALFHLNPLGAMLFAFANVLLYTRTRSLWVCMAAHALNNLIVVGIEQVERHSVTVIWFSQHPEITLPVMVGSLAWLRWFMGQSWRTLCDPLPPDTPYGPDAFAEAELVHASRA
jgi:membrane protease YdiL (CAAX protease family)